jgi:hypothetical protein
MDISELKKRLNLKTGKDLKKDVKEAAERSSALEDGDIPEQPVGKKHFNSEGELIYEEVPGLCDGCHKDVAIGDFSVKKDVWHLCKRCLKEANNPKK